MVYAIIHAGGKQYRVSEGDEVLLERIKGEEGDKVELGKVMLVNQEGELISDPKKLAKIKVKGTILEQTKEDKIIVFKYKPKKGFHQERGHRQSLTKVRVDKIVVPKKSEAADKAAPEPSSEVEAGEAEGKSK